MESAGREGQRANAASADTELGALPPGGELHRPTGRTPVDTPFL